MIDISNMNKADVLVKLYNASKPLGLGFLHFTPEDMTVSEAELLLTKYQYFDYLKGRVMKVDLSEAEFDESYYDRDNGEGAARRALDLDKE